MASLSYVEEKEVVVRSWRGNEPMQQFRLGSHSEESMNAPSVPLSQKKLEVLHFLEEHQEL